jgi:nitrogenase molybdenum-iron protein beta chain
MGDINSIEASRNSCLLHGAIETIQEIGGAVPILHSTAGCGLQQHLGVNKVSGCSGGGYIGGTALPSTNVTEKQVIFGGTSRLREQIKNTVKIIKGDLYVVLGGCTTELVGDDIPAMTKESQEQGYPIINANTPGFKGSVYNGYEVAVKTIIDGLPKLYDLSSEKINGLVNIFGIVPKQDVYWQGNLLELKRLLENIGLRVNTLLGFGEGVEQWKDVPRAELNIVFSSWGEEIGKYLEEKYDTPYLGFQSLPVGNDDTSLFIRQVANKVNLNEENVDRFINLEENKINHYLSNISEFYFEYNFQKEFAIVGESSTVIGISRFLVNSLGLIPKTFIITDNPRESYLNKIKNEINSLWPQTEITLNFTDDRGEINNIIKDSGVELLLGSSIENEIAYNLNIPLQHIAFPIWDSVVLDKTHIGFKGAITLLEDLGTLIRNFNVKFLNESLIS